jgi:hypothetical protein
MLYYYHIIYFFGIFMYVKWYNDKPWWKDYYLVRVYQDIPLIFKYEVIILKFFYPFNFSTIQVIPCEFLFQLYNRTSVPSDNNCDSFKSLIVKYVKLILAGNHGSRNKSCAQVPLNQNKAMFYFQFDIFNFANKITRKKCN